jgi:hypothetical protein
VLVLFELNLSRVEGKDSYLMEKEIFPDSENDIIKLSTASGPSFVCWSQSYLYLT